MKPELPDNSNIRLVIISSPRSGNTWIRNVLAGALELEEIAVHNYLDLNGPIPKRYILQTHWYREPNFQKWLIERQFRKITISRNPLDILVSVLHFSRHEPSVERWLEGNTEIPSIFRQVSPSSQDFLDYCLGFGAENLLSITYQWWQDSSVLKLRYEDCITNPAVVLGNLVTLLGGDSSKVLRRLELASLEKMKSLPNHHGWKATPGLYRKLIPSIHALRIYVRHKHLFDTLGYSFSPYLLSRKTAAQNWQSLRIDD